jgi:mono/diheme cytochrome c family protein
MIARPRRLAAVTPRALGLAALLLGSAFEARAEDPRIDYMLHCQGCHLPDGSGAPGAVPSLRDSIGRFLEVPGGRAFLVRVPGSAMSALDDAALASVLNWMIGQFGPQAASGFTPFDADEVTRYRSRPLVDVEATRHELLRQLDGLAQ